MHVHTSALSCIFLAVCLVFCSACISSDIPEAGEVPLQIIPTGTPALVTPAITQYLSPSPTQEEVTVNTSMSVPVGTPLPVTTTWIPKSTGRDAIDEPRIVLLGFVKEVKSYDIPDCGMREAFPKVAGDPAYGIRQKVPKLLMLTPEEIDEFQNRYSSHSGKFPDTERYLDTNSIGGARCTGVTADPRWNFVRINATLIPRNARPGEYDIGINVRSHGTIIEQVRLNRTFVIEEPIIFVRYIPLKLEEMDAFDSIELVFSRRE